MKFMGSYPSAEKALIYILRRTCLLSIESSEIDQNQPKSGMESGRESGTRNLNQDPGTGDETSNTNQ